MSEPELSVQEALEQARNLPAVRASEAIMARGELSVDEVVAQKDKIREVMERVMKPNVHYGIIPGTTRPTLLKPGAEAIDVALRLAPHYTSDRVFHDDGHLTVSVLCELQHIPTGLVIATGEGLCTTREQNYAWRTEKRRCPICNTAAIIKGKAEYGGGWVCWKKEGGCGEKFGEADTRINSQPEGRIPNPDLADTWNTVLKMADKRALIAAVLNGTAASDVFTQDVEDSPEAAPATTEARQAGPEAYPLPRSWAKVKEAVQACDEPEAWPIFEAYVRAASYHLYGRTDSKDLSQDERNVMRQKAAGAAAWLHDHIKAVGADFLYFGVNEQQMAWAAMLDGTILEIPDYQPPPAKAEAERLDEEAERLAREAFAD